MRTPVLVLAALLPLLLLASAASTRQLSEAEAAGGAPAPAPTPAPAPAPGDGHGVSIDLGAALLLVGAASQADINNVRLCDLVEGPAAPATGAVYKACSAVGPYLRDAYGNPPTAHASLAEQAMYDFCGSLVAFMTALCNPAAAAKDGVIETVGPQYKEGWSIHSSPGLHSTMRVTQADDSPPQAPGGPFSCMMPTLWSKALPILHPPPSLACAVPSPAAADLPVPAVPSPAPRTAHTSCARMPSLHLPCPGCAPSIPV